MFNQFKPEDKRDAAGPASAGSSSGFTPQASQTHPISTLRADIVRAMNMLVAYHNARKAVGEEFVRVRAEADALAQSLTKLKEFQAAVKRREELHVKMKGYESEIELLTKMISGLSAGLQAYVATKEEASKELGAPPPDYTATPDVQEFSKPSAS